MKRTLFRCWVSAALCAAMGASAADQVTQEALQRPALWANAPERAVLLAATVAGPRWIAVGERGIVVISDDHGQHWRQAQTPVSTTLAAVKFADAAHGWAVGHGGMVMATDDGGEHWRVLLDGHRLARQLWEDAEKAGDVRAIQEASALISDGADKPWLDLLVLDAQRVLVIGAYGLAMFSDDGGKHWHSWRSRLPNPEQLHLYTVRTSGKTWLLAGEQGLVLKSSDNGHSFERLNTPYQGSFFAAELLQEDKIILAGLRGNAVYSDDGGHSWQMRPLPQPVSVTATTRDANGHVLAVNQAGWVMRLQGDQWTTLNSTPLPPLAHILAQAGAPWLLLGIQGAHVFPEGGP